jgi:tetratricopeptide (TPR) repeat protein
MPFLIIQGIINYNVIFVLPMSKIIICITIFFSVSFSFGQNHRATDSLQKLIETTTADSIKAEATLQLALFYYSSDPQMAKELADQALKLGTKLNNAKVQAGSHLCMAYADYFIGNYPLAAKRAVRSIEFYVKTGDKKGEAYAYNQLGNIYNRQKNLTQAIECYQRSIQIKEEIGDKKTIASPLNNIGNIYAQMGKNVDAEKAFLQSLKIEIENGNMKGMAESYQCLGNLIAEKEPVGSKQFFDRALGIYDSLNDIESQVVCLSAVAINLVNANKFKESISYCDRALNIMNGEGSLYSREKIYAVLADANKQAGKYELACKYNDTLMQLKDSIYSSEISEQTAELKVKYETEKKEKEIAVLEKNNAEINLLAQERKTAIVLISSCLAILFLFILLLVFRNRTIKKQRETEFAKHKAELEQKALRAQMNPHFLFNSLNSIQRLFVEGKSDLANEFMADFGNLLRRILNNSGKDRISLKEELDTLKLYLDIEKMRCDGCFDYKIHIEEAIDQLNTDVPPLVIQPFAENAIWHGVLPKKSKGQINISIKKSEADNSLICLVEDNGKGFEKEKIGTNESKGIQITEQRLGSIVEFKTSANGTAVKIIIPLA